MSGSLVRSLRKLWAMVFPDKIVERDGITYHLNCRELIDNKIYLGAWEAETVSVIGALVRNGDTVVELGANVGAHTSTLAQLVGATGSVHAVEPTEFARTKLLRSIALNSGIASRISVHAYLITDSPAEEQNRLIKSSWGAKSYIRGRDDELVNSPAITLDELVATHVKSNVNFLKIDIDGLDYKALVDSVKTMERDRTYILVELC